MKDKIMKFHERVEIATKIFNFAFFVGTVLVWLYLTIISLLTHPFEFGLLWNAFNDMYAQLSFKIGCIVLIVFNGMTTIRSFLNQYMELSENLAHAHKTKEILMKGLSKK